MNAAVRACVAAVGLLLAAAAAAQESTPLELIRQSSERTLSALREQRDQVRDNPDVAFEIARENVLPLLDFGRAARWVLGPRWKDASEEQRSAFSAAFRDFLVRTYVAAMAAYVDQIIAHGDRVTYLPVNWAGDDGQALVRMIVHLEGGMNAEVGYRMHRRDGTWKVFDVTLEGVSMLTTYRVSFAAEVERKGLDALTKSLRRRAAGSGTALDGLVAPKR